ncbi:hypothetical protein [Chlorogloeopsis sp. ULAP02]|uniref:hypothetical protein n=1 Tax=Chlorogloeopsis sp. ULAP02 TaxID=3107926 RepID=UPI0031356626
MGFIGLLAFAHSLVEQALIRLDSVLEFTKQAVLESKAKFEAMGLEGDAFEKAIANSLCITLVNLRFRNYYMIRMELPVI